VIMKRILAIALVALLLCGGSAALPAVAAQPDDNLAEISAQITAQAAEGSFRRRWNYIRYRSTLQLQYTANVPVTFSVSENALGISIDNNGRVTSGFSLQIRPCDHHNALCRQRRYPRNNHSDGRRRHVAVDDHYLPLRLVLVLIFTKRR